MRRSLHGAVARAPRYVAATISSPPPPPPQRMMLMNKTGCWRSLSSLTICAATTRRRAHSAHVVHGSRTRQVHQRTGLHRSQAALKEEELVGAAPVSKAEMARLSLLRNIGISAHIDSGKTTLTERILYYTGRIKEIHEVRGKDNVGAKMDSMDLEREKGITIQSAATYTTWDGHSINIIDTPGHVDFTIEVERALRVLDGAVMVCCAVAGVQSQTSTVDRQMKRYAVPRITFINKMDRPGANYMRVTEQIKKKLLLSAAPIQIPIGVEDTLQGVVDLVQMKAYYNEGAKGEEVRVAEIPADLLEVAKERRAALIEAVAEHDEAIGELYIMEEDPTPQQLADGVRRATLSRKFTPVMMGSAYKNTGIQPLMDAVVRYLPNPSEVPIEALDVTRDEAKVALTPSADSTLVGLAFKLEEGRFGQLTYLRVYQGVAKKGNYVTNVRTGKRVKLSRVVRMHSNEMEDVDEIRAGEICALFGVDCASGDTFTDPEAAKFTMTSMFVPNPVISLSLTPVGKETLNFGRALNRFQREDPTFRVHVDNESKETIISGMGELHLEIYVERMKREYGVECTTGKPQVAFRETITKRVPFEYVHKKQSGGAGQYAKVMGHLEPICDEEGSTDRPMENEFSDETSGTNVPSQFVPGIEKGFHDAAQKGSVIGHAIVGTRFILEDGMSHAVDSSELAFRIAAQNATRIAYATASPIILEPVMEVTVTAPSEFQGTVVAGLNKRRGIIGDTDTSDAYVTVTAEVPLNAMFGYSTDLRSATQGKGEFSMEYKKHQPATHEVQKQMVDAYQKQLAASRQ